MPVEADIADRKCGLGCRLGKLPVEPFVYETVRNVSDLCLIAR